ncbi:30S ribosomal protein THX [Empedobacter sp. UBA7248]|jgi:30S ribosomal protein S31|nr:30S ribosomal protein THX [Empedobacter sp. UBA7248]HCC94327.1 30S ribosomal protein THX [Flavobacteriaceae bacterium]
MGKGDKKSRRGKIVNGSYGVKRPRHKYYYEEDVVDEKATKKAKK